jgi:MOSC domain-containing protein YiiM
MHRFGPSWAIHVNSPTGIIASLHLHPITPGEPFATIQEVEVVEGKGIPGDHRYFGRLSHKTGEPTRRQVSLIEREQIAEHAIALGLAAVPPGAVRSNIETTGIDLVSLLGRQIQIGEAILLIYAPRDPCEKMDAICQGLRERMMNNRQGVMAQVLRTGKLRVGDTIHPI